MCAFAWALLSPSLAWGSAIARASRWAATRVSPNAAAAPPKVTSAVLLDRSGSVLSFGVMTNVRRPWVPGAGDAVKLCRHEIGQFTGGDPACYQTSRDRNRVSHNCPS